MEFKLVKWYGDCIAGDGRCAVVYWASLRWHGLRIRYASILEASPDTAPDTRTSFHPGAAPEPCGETFHWDEPRLKTAWNWRPLHPPHRRILLNASDGLVDWRCLAPAAVVAFTGASGQLLEGRGYLERLELTLPPWRLPIESLLWGRFISTSEPAASLVWIRWQGPSPLSLTLSNGLPSSVEPDEALTLQKRLVLREGLIGPGILSSIPGLAATAPARLLGIHERKWLSRGVLNPPGQPPSEGWAIHEVVQWP